MDYRAILIGEITGVFGLKGAVKVKSLVDDPAIFKKLKQCTLTDSKGVSLEVNVTGTKWHSDRWLLQFEGVETPESAMLLKNNRVYITTDKLPVAKSDEVYWVDIEGAEVKDKDGNPVGTLVDFIETGATDVLVIEAVGGERYLISNNPSHVLSITAENKLVIIDRIGLVAEN